MRLTRSLQQLLRPACPVYVHKLGPVSSLSFSSNPEATPVGTFANSQLENFTKAFNTEPDKFEPVPLIERPDDFTENKKFMPKVHEYLKHNVHKCPVFSALAAAEDKTHFFHIYDLRNPPTIGRIPAVEDILGTVEINEQGIVKDSYQANTMYRPVSTYGALMLSKEMAKGLAGDLVEKK